MEVLNDNKLENQEKISLMVELIKKYHADQYRNNGRDPYWKHCVDTSELLENHIREIAEISDEELINDLKLAALGHDLLEDTKISIDEIEGNFGTRVLGLIRNLTNFKGDSDRKEYLEQMTTGAEEAKLIKLADMIENCTSVSYNIGILGVEWVQSFFLPIISEMKENMIQQNYINYPKTASRLIELLNIAYQQLLTNIEKFNQTNMETQGDSYVASLLSKARAENADYDKEVDQRIQKAIEENPDKEKFDVKKLGELYNFNSGLFFDNQPAEPTEDEIRNMKKLYYLDFPELKTLQDLADKLKWLDANSAN